MLAIAAARLGFAPVDAVELDAGRGRADARNAAANGVAVDARVRPTWSASAPPWAPTVVANLHAGRCWTRVAARAATRRRSG